MRLFLIAVAGLHTLFMISELLPWPQPLLLYLASKKLPDGESFTVTQRKLVAAIVHNAGIYNGIVAAGLFWAAFGAQPATDLARLMLIGAAVAGVFGTLTLKSPVTALQAILGIVGAILISR